MSTAQDSARADVEDIEVPPMSREEAAAHSQNFTSSGYGLKASMLASRVMDPPKRNLLAGAAMAEPTSSAAGGFVIWKAFAGLLAVGVIASGLGFMVLPPKTPREFALRAIATMIGSALLGPLFVAAAYSKWPEVFAAGATMAQALGMDNWMGMFMVGAPLLAMAGLPFWWILGAAVLWFDNRKGKDLGELVQDAKAIVP